MSNFMGNLEGNLEELRQLLKTETFEPVPVRRAYIPKPDGRKRPLGMPTIRDRIVQESLRMILEPIWEADFSIHSYGFRPNRSTYDAIASIGNRLAGQGSIYQWVIEGDIKSYFDRAGCKFCVAQPLLALAPGEGHSFLQEWCAEKKWGGR